MRILIDADGCPVTNIAIEIGKEFDIKSVLFCDTSHIFIREDVEIITVSKGVDSADFALVNQTEKGDIIVTQDYGLAAMALSKGGIPITQNGMVINDFNLGGLLESRHQSKKLRMQGKHLKGPSKRTKDQDEKFEKNLRDLIHKEINKQ